MLLEFAAEIARGIEAGLQFLKILIKEKCAYDIPLDCSSDNINLSDDED